MAIQFRCESCEQPIEVDDEFAGQQAACPYCQHVNAVPMESTLRPAEESMPVSEASPVSDDDPAMTESETETPYVRPEERFEPSPPPLRTRSETARMYGNFGLVCAGIVVALFLGMLVLSVVMAARQQASGAPQTIEEMTKQLQGEPEAAWITGTQCGMIFSAVVGTALAITSLVQGGRREWRGWVALGICGGALLCSCGMMALGLMMMSMGGALPA